DNMFVFIIIFRYFAIPPLYQSRVLHWGILGAIVMRFIFIFAGVSLINAFHWMIYVFGGLLIYTGAKMAFQNEEHVDPSRNPALKLLKRFFPLTQDHHDEKFFVSLNGVLHATPLFATLLVVEFSDLVFALDSIPAIIAITTDTLVVYTSNVFAIMGLRALFFLLANLVNMFRFLKIGISLILVFVGLKMLGSMFYHVPTGASLGVIAAILASSVAASLLAKK
ncbi:MAG TPA: tellurium resistance protein TerC, partial [Elusimicrobia bacterium]|nr:tellurium resistance protein TerC [Elusimicrobiota bacterium]